MRRPFLDCTWERIGHSFGTPTPPAVTTFSFKALPARWVLPVFLLIVFLGPVVLGPVLFYLLQPFHIPFHRAMSRALLFSALVALFLFRDRLRLRQWWPWDRAAVPQLALGWFIAFVSGQAMVGLYLACCGFTFTGVTLGHTLLFAAIAALIVPILEETIFRGFLVTTLVEAAGPRAGWLLAALIYALAHFLKVPTGANGEQIHLWSGATGMLGAFAQLGHGDFLGGRGLNLFFVGLVLGGVFLRVGRLWICAGLHSGWIFILMSFSGLTRPTEPPRVPFLGGDLLASPIVSAVVLAVGLFLWRFYPPRSDATAD
jgi:membrane protease YdiL (CAAX protease family)